MTAIQKQKIFICFYVIVLFSLFLCVSATPLLIRQNIPISHGVIIEEETVETALIVVLLGISFIILRSFKHTLKIYRRVAKHAGKENSRLVSRLAEAFSYIGTVNVEMQELESILCGVKCYPRSKREFKELVEQLGTKAMTVAGVPWLVVRMIDRHSVQTIYEHAVRRFDKKVPPATLGNRDILSDQQNHGLQTIRSCQRNMELLTVFIMPKTTMTDDRSMLLMVILNQIEMRFMIFRVGYPHLTCDPDTTQKEVVHDSNS